MPSRINRAIELLEQDQAIYYTGGHSGHMLTYAQGREDAHVWADYINVGMEHGAFDMAGLAEYMRGLVEGGPTRAGHRTPAVIVEAPVNGTDRENVRFNAWQFRQILGRGVHGVLMCQAESAEAVRAFVESCRYPHQSAGVDPALPSPVERMHEAVERRAAAAPNRPPLRSGGSRRRNISSAATPGRSTGKASCCSASSSKAPRASPIARRSSLCRGSVSPNWAPAISVSRSATSRFRATRILSK